MDLGGMGTPLAMIDALNRYEYFVNKMLTWSSYEALDLLMEEPE